MNFQYNKSFFESGPHMPISSHVRFLNTVADMPPLDLYADGEKYADNVAYREFTDYYPVPPGIYEVKLFPAGETENPVNVSTQSFPAGGSFTVVAIGTPDQIELYQIPEPYSSPATGLRSYIRFVNLSETSPPFDIALQNGTLLFEDVDYNDLTSYTRLVPNVYTFIVKSAGTNDILLVIPDLRLNAGKIYTVYIIGNVSGTPPLEALFVADSEYSGDGKNAGG